MIFVLHCGLWLSFIAYVACNSISFVSLCVHSCAYAEQQGMVAKMLRHLQDRVGNPLTAAGGAVSGRGLYTDGMGGYMKWGSNAGGMMGVLGRARSSLSVSPSSQEPLPAFNTNPFACMPSVVNDSGSLQQQQQQQQQHQQQQASASSSSPQQQQQQDSQQHAARRPSEAGGKGQASARNERGVPIVAGNRAVGEKQQEGVAWERCLGTPPPMTFGECLCAA